MEIIIYFILGCLWLGSSLAFLYHHKKDERYWYRELNVYYLEPEALTVVIAGSILPLLAIPIAIFYLFTKAVLKIIDKTN